MIGWIAALALAAGVNEQRLQWVDIFMSPTVIVPRTELQPAQVTASYGQRMWSADLAIEQVAALQRPVEIAAGGMAGQLTPATPLWRATPRNGHLEGQPFRGKLYCGVRFDKGTPDASELFDLVFRADWDSGRPRLCLYDENSDGAFDHAVAAGRIKEGPIVTPIAATPYIEQSDLRVPGATMQLRPHRNALVGKMELQLDGYLRDMPVHADGLLLQPPGSATMKMLQSLKMVPKGSFPNVIEFAGLQITALAYDAQSNALTARLDSGFYRTPVVFGTRPKTMYIMYVR